MIVTCPQCSAKYNVPLTALPPTGRKTRCIACGHVWLEGAPPAEAINAFAAAEAVPVPPATVADPVTEIAPKGRKVAPAKVPRWPVPWNRIAAGLAFLCLTLAGGLVIFRGPIAEAAPALVPMYALAGLPTGTVDDWFQRVSLTADPYTEGETQGLKLTGSYRNTSSHAHAMPPVKVFWQAADGTLGPLVTTTPATGAAAPAEVAPKGIATFTADLTGMDMSGGGQAGAVLTGGRYDEKLMALLVAQNQPAAKDPALKTAAAPVSGHALPVAPPAAGGAHE